MLHTAMAVGLLGRRADADASHGNELWYGQRGKHNEEEKYSHGLFDNAHQGKNVNKLALQILLNSDLTDEK